MKAELLNIDTGKAKAVTLSDEIFSLEPRKDILNRVVRWLLARRQQGSHSVKTRSEGSYSKSKIYRQKGTGRARAGTIRSPLWRGGGVTFAARPRDYSKKLNKKMYRAAIKSIFSELVRQNRLVAIEKPVLKKPKTKEIASFLNEFSLSKVLIIIDELDMNLYLSARNIPNVDVITVREINPVNLLKPQKVAVTSEALKQIEEWING